ncbi:MAG: hypothetical protein IPN46_06775 [Saprospiraceae bacterium]|nr:hypothetical protein [Saprospiraceae bacterium]
MYYIFPKNLIENTPINTVYDHQKSRPISEKQTWLQVLGLADKMERFLINPKISFLSNQQIYRDNGSSHQGFSTRQIRDHYDSRYGPEKVILPLHCTTIWSITKNAL